MIVTELDGLQWVDLETHQAANRERDELRELAERLEVENSELKAELARREANGSLVERIAELEAENARLKGAK